MGWHKACGIFPHLLMDIWKFQFWFWRRGQRLTILLLFFPVGRSGSSWKAGFGNVSSGGSMEDAVRTQKLGIRSRENRTQLQFGFPAQASSSGTMFVNSKPSCSQDSRNSRGTEDLFPCEVFSESSPDRCFLRLFNLAWDYSPLGWSFRCLLSGKPE